MKKFVWSAWYSWIAVALILVINMLMKWHFFCGLVQADDFSYGVYAYTLFREPFSWDMSMDFRAFRFALIFPVSMLFRLFQPSEFIAILYPLIISSGTIIVIYFIGEKLYGESVGLLSAFVLALFPGDVIYGTILLPDIIVPFFLGMAIFAFIKAEDTEEKYTMLWYFITGVSVFLAFNARENSYYFLLFFLPFAFVWRRWERGLYLIGLGFIVPLLLLYGVYYIKSGDFLYLLHLAENHRDPLIRSGYIPPNSVNWHTILFYMVPGFFRRTAGIERWSSSMFGYTFYLGIMCIAYSAILAVRKRSPLRAIVPWWFFIGYLILEFGSISFSSYQMMLKLPRFLLTLTPPMAIGYGIVLADIFGSVKKRVKSLGRQSLRWVTLCCAVAGMVWIIVTSYTVMAAQKSSMEYNMSIFRWGYYDILKNKPHKPVYTTGGWWNNKLSFYYLPDLRYADVIWHHSDMLRDLKAVKNPNELAGSYIVMDRNNFSGQNDLRIKHSYDDFMDVVKLPPKSWNLLGRRDLVEIYDVPDGWTYKEPDGKEFALNSLLYSLEIGDYILFLSDLHPDFLSGLTREKFIKLIDILTDTSNPEREKLLSKGISYRDDKGRMKIIFTID